MATQLGLALARSRALILCDGSNAVNRAVCQGARAGGGIRIGFLPGSVREAATAEFDVEVPTGIGEGRGLLVVRSAQALVAVGEESGNRREIPFALKLGVPVIGLGVSRFAGGGLVQPLVRLAATPEEVVSVLTEIAQAAKGDTTHLWSKQRLTTGAPATSLAAQ